MKLKKSYLAVLIAAIAILIGVPMITEANTAQDGAVAYYNMSHLQSNADATGNGFNGTAMNVTNCVSSPNGLAYNFSARQYSQAEDDFTGTWANTTLNDVPFLGINKLSINYLVRFATTDLYNPNTTSGNTGNGFYIFGNSGGGTNNLNMRIFNNNSVNDNRTEYTVGTTTTSDFNITTTTFKPDQWYMLTMVWEKGQRMLFYVDGILDVNSSATNSNMRFDNIITLGALKTSTLLNNPVAGISGCLDEFAFWNRTLTTSEIIELNKSIKAGETYPFKTAPGLIVQSPVNLTTQAISSNISLNITASDLNTYTCYFTNSTGSTYEIPSCNNVSFIAVKGLNTVNITVNDSFQNYNSSIISFVFNDTQNPLLSIELPINRTTIYNQSGFNASFNFTFSDNGFRDTCLFTNITGNRYSIGECSNFTFITAADGNFTIHLFVNDSAGNFNFSNISITVDGTFPSYLIGWPLNDSLSIRQNVSLNFSMVDANPNVCFYQNVTGDGNITIPSCANTTFLGIDGLNNLTLFINDTAGHLNSTTIYFKVDINGPSLAFSNVTPTTVTSGNIVRFTVNVSESISNISSVCVRFKDANGNMAGTSCTIDSVGNTMTLASDGVNEDQYEFNFTTGNPVGTYNVINFTARDSSANNNTLNSTFTFIVNQAPSGGGAGGAGGASGAEAPECVTDIACQIGFGENFICLNKKCVQNVTGISLPGGLCNFNGLCEPERGESVINCGSFTDISPEGEIVEKAGDCKSVASNVAGLFCLDSTQPQNCPFRVKSFQNLLVLLIAAGFVVLVVFPWVQGFIDGQRSGDSGYGRSRTSTLKKILRFRR